MKLEKCPTCYLNYPGKILTIVLTAMLFAVSAFEANAQARSEYRSIFDRPSASDIVSIKKNVAKKTTTTQTAVKAPSSPTLVAASAVSISQCANGKITAPEICNDTDSWVTGNVNQAKAHYNEGDTIAYRAVFTGLTVGQTYTYSMEWDTTKAGLHAIDYLTTYNRTEEDADPCFDVTCVGAPSTFPIPADPRVTAGPTSPFAGDDINPGPDGTAGTADDALGSYGNFTLWNGTITSVSDYTLTQGTYVNGAYVGDTSTAISVTFTANSTTAVLAWGGHISHRKDWGADASAINITGSPYHMRNHSWSDGTVGQADLQLAASAVSMTASVRVIKALAAGIDAAGHDFTFTYSITGGSGGSFVNAGGSGVFGAGTFTLDVDGGADTTWSNEVTSVPISNLAAGISATGTITELPGPGSFQLQSIVCSESGPVGYSNAASAIDLPNRTVNVNLQEGELLTCTFTNNVVLAATASITGQVLNSAGTGIRNAYVTLTDANTGQVTTVLTNQWGYYKFTNLEVGHFYTLDVSAKRYTFANSSQSFSLGDNMAGVNFVAN